VFHLWQNTKATTVVWGNIKRQQRNIWANFLTDPIVVTVVAVVALLSCPIYVLQFFFVAKSVRKSSELNKHPVQFIHFRSGKLNNFQLGQLATLETLPELWQIEGGYACFCGRQR